MTGLTVQVDDLIVAQSHADGAAVDAVVEAVVDSVVEAVKSGPSCPIPKNIAKI